MTDDERLKLRQALAALEAQEWVTDLEQGFEYCPSCLGGSESWDKSRRVWITVKNHKPDCSYDRALENIRGLINAR